ncbi:MAG TPA: hypothetical protein VLI46_02120 [Ramlibacter sp.]|nr:hypothetical protein [Ramlibacter sp.]
MKHLIVLLLLLLWAAMPALGAPVFENTMAQRTLACTAGHDKDAALPAGRQQP